MWGWKVRAIISDPDEITQVDISVQHLLPRPPGVYPTLHAIGLGPQLAELERICAESARGKHAGESVLDLGVEQHTAKALGHLVFGDTWTTRDATTHARHLVHAAARLLMASACADAEGRP